MVNAVWPVVCATGHRPQHMPAEVHGWVRTELDRVAAKLRDEHGTTVGISGMALGTDMWWARSVLAAGLELHAYVPFPQQPDRWPAHAKREWQRLLGLAAKVRYFGEHYDVRLLFQRNDDMVRDAHATVAVLDPDKATGGTVSAVRWAQGLGRPIVHLNPATMRTGLMTSGVRA